uniref:Uncharacterized protein n=1 Tax=Lepeophtheirus salmonis TaxID=72036 RepID=A0A0K2TTE2_LEPSM
MFNERDCKCAPIQIMLSDHMKLSNADISGLLSMPVRTVRSLRKQLDESSDPRDVVDRKKKEEKSTRIVEDVTFINNVRDINDEDTQRSMRAIARNLGVAEWTVRACVKEDLRCKSYRRQTA